MELGKFLSRQTRWRTAAGIMVFLFFFLAGNASASPPPAILEIDGKNQSAGIGDNCWKVGNETYMLCSDTFSIITPREPLLTRSPFTALLRLPFQERPEESGFSVTPVTDKNESYENQNDFFRAWNFDSDDLNWKNLPPVSEPYINLSLPPGLYVLKVFAKWEGKGDVTYGFLVKVTPAEKVAGLEAAQAITIILVISLIVRIKLRRKIKGG